MRSTKETECFQDGCSRILVLLIEDTPEVASAIATYLEKIDESLTVITEDNATSGCERFEANPVDCVICDYKLPRTTGASVLKKVRSTNPDLPFFILTGMEPDQIETTSVVADATDIIQKGGPSAYRDLIDQIHDAVESNLPEDQ